MLRVSLVFGCLALAACAPDPVKWDSDSRAAALPAVGARLMLNGGDTAVMVAEWKAPSQPSGSPLCDGSLVATMARGDTAFAAWWSPRPDSSALLLVARSD